MPSHSDAAHKIEDALHAIADGKPVPWSDLENDSGEPGELDILHLLDDVAAAYRSEENAAAPNRRAVLFRWGALEVEERLGEGSFGEVYRAFDPWLGRHVALKLFRDNRNGGAGLDEARRLARLRHRNVLGVYGCGVHDGRAGLWSELIDGRTLAAVVDVDGAFAPEEAIRCGRGVAQALAAVHAAGLVHGDVKAENVMRESGGRIVLMDFVAGGYARLLASQRLISGTPRYLPPEVLDGAPLGAASDIYAFGVLLFALLSGRYPYRAVDAASLREEQRRGGRPTLRELRPELSAPLCALVESCLALDPAQRPANAPIVDAKLAELQRAQAPAAASRRLQFIGLAAALAALLVAAGVLLRPWLAPPAWDASAQFLRVEPSGNMDIAANSTLRVGERLRLSLRSSRDAWVYVLNEDAAGNATVLFPLAGGTPNPQHGGSPLLLPGGGDSSLAWEVTADSAHEEFLVISSLRPLADLDRELASWNHARSANATRAVGAVVDAPAPELRGEHLRRILAGLAQDPAHVRVWQFSFPHAL
ncbi:MAG: protein kinase domain-containing protein [Deltaproteobacteria bacterium]